MPLLTKRAHNNTGCHAHVSLRHHGSGASSSRLHACAAASAAVRGKLLRALRATTRRRRRRVRQALRSAPLIVQRRVAQLRAVLLDGLRRVQ
jgi:hypothetical protein